MICSCSMNSEGCIWTSLSATWIQRSMSSRPSGAFKPWSWKSSDKPQREDRNMFVSRAICLLTTIAGLGLMNSAACADDTVLDSRMYHDPELPSAKVVRVYPDNLLPLWLIALNRPEADYQCRAALAIVQAHREGIKGLETAIDPLLQALARLDSSAEENAVTTGQHDTGSSSKFLVQLAIARALVELDARQTAPQLFQLTQADDRRLRDVIEPALALWGFRPVVGVWLKRLRQPEVNSA